MPNSALPVAVTDLRAHRSAHTAHATKVLGRSPQRLSVFEAIYYHKQRVKSVSELEEATGLNRIRILQIGNELVKHQLVGQTVKSGEVAYVQDPSFQVLKADILRILRNPTKSSVNSSAPGHVTVTVRQQRAKAPRAPKFVTIDEIGSFSKVRGTSPIAPKTGATMSEEQFKEGVKRIIGEVGRFKDWGGEQNDLFTTGLIVGGRRRRAVFAFKGPGQQGVLRPKHMGKNGDQIKRLFDSAADVFIVQYHGQIHELTVEEMELRARILASERSSKIWYGTIDGTDSNRLVAAYPGKFVANGADPQRPKSLRKKRKK